jgi:cytochrome c2
MRLPALSAAVLLLTCGGLMAPAVAQDAEEFDYGGLTPGPGREAVYFTCRACHSLKQFTQQRMSRDDWDAVIARMVQQNEMAAPEPWVRTQILAYLSTHFGVDEENWQGLPPGPGREEVFYTCQACHSLKIVVQQGLTRHSWDETLVWMVEEQGMPELEEEERDLILDYLAEHYGPDS